MPLIGDCVARSMVHYYYYGPHIPSLIIFPTNMYLASNPGHNKAMLPRDTTHDNMKPSTHNLK